MYFPHILIWNAILVEIMHLDKKLQSRWLKYKTSEKQMEDNNMTVNFVIIWSNNNNIIYSDYTYIPIGNKGENTCF